MMPEMPVSEKTVLLRECNSDVFSIGYSNQENDSYFNFLQTGICLLLFDVFEKKTLYLRREHFCTKWTYVNFASTLYTEEATLYTTLHTLYSSQWRGKGFKSGWWV